MLFHGIFSPRISLFAVLFCVKPAAMEDGFLLDVLTARTMSDWGLMSRSAIEATLYSYSHLPRASYKSKKMHQTKFWAFYLLLHNFTLHSKKSHESNRNDIFWLHFNSGVDYLPPTVPFPRSFWPNVAHCFGAVLFKGCYLSLHTARQICAPS